MFCGKCGEKISDDAQFCNQCGATVARRDIKGDASDSSAVKFDLPTVLIVISICFYVLAFVDFLGGFLCIFDITGFKYSPAIFVLIGSVFMGLCKFCVQESGQGEASPLGGKGTVSGSTVSTAASALTADNKYVYRFDTTVESTSIIGCKLKSGETPIALFGKNTKIGVVTLTGWSGIAFTNLGMHYKLFKVFENKLLRMIVAVTGAEGVAEGFVPYENIHQLSIQSGDGIRVYCNETPLGKFVTGKDEANEYAVAALKQFCEQIIK